MRCQCADAGCVTPINTEQLVSTVLNNEGQSRLTNDSHGFISNNDNTYAKVTAHRPPTKTIQHNDVPNKGVIIEKSIMINNAGYILCCVNVGNEKI